MPNDECVEAARLTARQLGVRDSKAPTGDPVLLLSPAQWNRLLKQIRGGVHDLH